MAAGIRLGLRAEQSAACLCGHLCTPQPRCSLSDQPLKDCPEDPCRWRHGCPILSLLASCQGALNSPTHVCLQLPTSESKWSRVGADKGAEEDRRSRHPLPWALPGISAVLLPLFVNGNLQMNGPICFQTVGMNLSVREQVSRRASTEQETAWMWAEHDLSLVNFLNAPCPRWEETDLLFWMILKRLLCMSTPFCFRGLFYKRIYGVNAFVEMISWKNFWFHFSANCNIHVGTVRQHQIKGDNHLRLQSDSNIISELYIFSEPWIIVM